VTKRSIEGSLPLVTFLNTNQVISVAEVELGKYCRALNGFKSRGYYRQRILTLFFFNGEGAGCVGFGSESAARQTGRQVTQAEE